MATVPVLAITDFTYQTRVIHAGEVCEMLPEEAIVHAQGLKVSLDAVGVAIARRKAERAAAGLPAPTVVDDALLRGAERLKQPKAKRQYRRRDLTAEKA